MPNHPFTYAYIGLGLLDESSIQRDGDAWAAEYRDARGEPYLVIVVSPTRARILEYEGDRRIAVTVAPTLNRAIGMHGGDALAGDRSRFWERVAPATPLAWVQTACPHARFSFVPAMALGELCLPLPAAVTWRPPAPGPIARRIGLGPFDGKEVVVRATLRRFADGTWARDGERIDLVKVTIPGILVAEAVDSYFAAYGRTRSIEWRPFVLVESKARVEQLWQPLRRVQSTGELGPEAFSIVEDGGAPQPW